MLVGWMVGSQDGSLQIFHSLLSSHNRRWQAEPKWSPSPTGLWLGRASDVDLRQLAPLTQSLANDSCLWSAADYRQSSALSRPGHGSWMHLRHASVRCDTAPDGWRLFRQWLKSELSRNITGGSSLGPIRRVKDRLVSD